MPADQADQLPKCGGQRLEEVVAPLAIQPAHTAREVPLEALPGPDEGLVNLP